MFCCLSGERNVRDVPVTTPAVASEPKNDADKKDDNPAEKKEDTQPADKQKEEKSTSSVNKSSEESTFLVRVRT